MCLYCFCWEVDVLVCFLVRNSCFCMIPEEKFMFCICFCGDIDVFVWLSEETYVLCIFCGDIPVLVWFLRRRSCSCMISQEALMCGVIFGGEIDFCVISIDKLICVWFLVRNQWSWCFCMLSGEKSMFLYELRG